MPVNVEQGETTPARQGAAAARRAARLSWASFLIFAVLFGLAAVLSPHAPRERGAHRRAAARWQAKQDEKFNRDLAKGKTPRPVLRPAWRKSPALTALADADRAVFRAVNGGWDNRFFDAVMPPITHMGDGAFQSAALLLAALWAGRTRRRRWLHTALLGVVGVVLSAISPLLKQALPRFRPPHQMPYDVVLLVKPLYGGSFPSGHTMSSFVIAAVIARRHPWTAPWAYGLAVLIGVSRVAVGVHWPLDVLASALLGTGIGWLVCVLWEWRARRSQEDEGR